MNGPGKWQIRVHPLPVMLALLLLTGVTTADDAGAEAALRQEKIRELYAEVAREFPSVATITAAGAAALMQTGRAVFVDIREREEQAVSMISGALRQEEMAEKAQQLTGKTIIAYCTIGHRSALFAREMADRGISVFNLEEGLLGWITAGHPVFAQGRAVDRVHVYGPGWDLAPRKYETVSFGFFRRLF